jgi:two-component system, chemotaxis family, response regulator Rcp1
MAELKPEKNILLVEDNYSHIRLIQEAWKDTSQFHIVNTVRNGVEALAYLRRQGDFQDAIYPDLILLDLNLPKKDGREVLAEIKADPSLRKIPVIILTTSRNEEDIAKSYDLHANCYITKPRNLTELFQVMNQIREFWLKTATLPGRI